MEHEYLILPVARCGLQSIRHKHRVTVLNLTSEGLGGTITPSIGNLTFLNTLDLSLNNLHGEIPSSIGRLSRLRFLRLSNNSLHGNIDTGLKNCTRLEKNYLGTNQFTGEIPPSLTNLSALQNIDFTTNRLQGFIPEGLGTITSLILIQLGENHLSGIIPANFFNISSLTVFSVAGNELHGKLPSNLGDRLTNIQYLLLGKNHLTGSLPAASLVNATEMSGLDMSSNNFTGILPREIGLLCPDYLSLEMNQLTAATAQDWEFMTLFTNCTSLGTLDLFFNNLGGMLPSSIANLSAQLKELDVGYNQISGNIPLGISNLVRINQLDLTNNRFTGALPDGIGRPNLLQALYFENNLLTGSFPSSIGNLTRFITCCSSSDLNQNDFKAIVFEFMTNGSLDRWLNLDVRASQQLQSLTLAQRLNIAVDIADALDYLHNNCEPPIVHCDLKPSNILLDEDLVAHVGDFGLAKILPEPGMEQPMNSKSSVGIRGTIGYVAPEYGQGGQVSPCGDIYSFGIVVLELFTGMAPTHGMFLDRLTLQKHVEKNAFTGMLMQIVDPALLSIQEAMESSLQDRSNAMGHESDAVFSVMKVALSCCKHNPTERMSMRDASAVVRKIRDAHAKMMRRGEEVVRTAHDARPFAETSSAAETSRPAP
ncbi:hypothetical protein ACQ4PT_053810 [Festuca glaucescens]